MSDFNHEPLYKNPDDTQDSPQGSPQQPDNSYQQPDNSYQQPNNGYQQPNNGYQQPDSNSWQYPPQQNTYYNGYNQGANQTPYYTVPGQGQLPQKETNPMAVTSMVLGIFSIISCCASPLAVLLGIGGIVLAILSKKGKPMSGFAIAGIILSAIGLVISLAFFAYYLFVLSLMKDPRYASFFNEILEQYQMLQ
ncbi:MAG: hypothetical protein ACLSX5_10485 [Lachnospiraceae bacterium]